MATFFETSGLSKSFGGIRAVRDLNLAVEEGQILGIAGPNGSGKSTFFNVITKTPFGPDSGRALLEGRDILKLRPHEIAREGIARTFQRESVFATMSAVDNVLAAIDHSHRRARFRANVDAAEHALDLVGFPATLHNMPAGGLPIFLRKLVMIASALALRPRLLLLDEPASSLTPHEIGRVQSLILKLKSRGITIVLIEHVLPLLSAVSDRLAVLDQGVLIAHGLPEEVVASPAVIEAFLGKKQ